MNHKNRRFWLLSLIVFCILLVIGNTASTIRINRLLDQDTQHALEEVNGQSKDIVLRRLETDLKQLHNLARAVVAYGGVSSAQTKKMLEKYETNGDNIGIRYTIIDPQGHGYTSDGYEGEYSDIDAYQMAMRGEDVISNLINSPVDGTDVIVIAVPIEENGRVTGVASCSYRVNEYEDLISFSLFGSAGRSYILNRDGSTVFWPNDVSQPFGQTPDKSFIEGGTLDRIPAFRQFYEDMQAGESGILKYKDADTPQKMFLSYMPLGLNDWYVVNEISSNVVSHTKNSIFYTVLFGGIVMCLLVLCLLYFYLRSQKKRDMEQEKYLYYDRLSGLHNRQYLLSQYGNNMVTGHRQYAFLLFEVNDFSKINQILGYRVGSRLVLDIAQVLKKNVKQCDVAFHISGGCFALGIPYGNKEELSDQVDRLLARLKGLPVTDGQIEYDIPCHFSAGVYLLDGEDETSEMIYEKAETAMHAAGSHADETTWKYYDESMDSRSKYQKELAEDIPEAIRTGAFVPYFQPLYSIKSGEIVGAEILARWNHPVKGILPPGDFLPVLEETGMVLDLDLIMVEAGCRKISEWIAKGVLPVTLSVNISRLNVHRKDFYDRMRQLVQKYKLPPNMLLLETKKAALSDQFAQTSSLMSQLKELGFVLAMDDYEWDTSFLNLIKNMPLDVLKLDRKFLTSIGTDEKSLSILRYMVNVTSSLHVDCMAEGVENQEMETFLIKAGCDTAQGFYYNKPMSAEEFEQYIN